MGQRCVFYNVENLFYPEWDSLNPDQEFTPDGAKEWTAAKYFTRIQRLSKVILSLSDSSFQAPALVGMAEIEEARVLNDLIHRSALAKIPYQYVHYDSPDRRGIDVGLIYRKDLFRLIDSKTLPFYWPEIPEYRSRDMLYAQFEDSLHRPWHFVICHWPSRYGGQQSSEPKRLAAAKILSVFLDSLKLGPEEILIVMGDFNDEPNDKSLKYLGGKPEHPRLYNLMASKDQNGGSHRYKGDWAYLDQILIRPEMQEWTIHCAAFEAPFLMEEESKLPGYKPRRAFKGPFFSSGYSDHLPVYIDLIIKTQPLAD
ncbi:endonuclease/exonuclease/phosphatase family protein [Croceimicrobium sp.]|uniref:endonuclease/exonuclease/phosphatase family protein n=1 Tax=Croceimicrobium sp. TaxID=2828340 RepID=UPI003BA95FB4